ncbi:hypothetical protein ACMD2_17667 [Ananas comosus]|uniref:Uncharacterized protein n=1 Tax=Ananas comosus TaxID=4615 RepID=A0A199W526_ANACO|nr:hypothetical protein ACMD2_17667 [Ananas comosus]
MIQVLDTRGRLLTALGYGLWPPVVLLSEIVQTFILADFCYYYVKRRAIGSTSSFRSGVTEEKRSLLLRMFYQGIVFS